MKRFKLGILLLFIISCNTPKAAFDYDNQVDFKTFSSYALFPDFQSGLSQLDQARLIESLDFYLKEEGFENSSETPDIYVNVYTEKFEQDNRSRIGVGLGGGGGNVGVGVSGGIPVGQMDTYLKLTFDFISVKDDELVWQAIVESPFNLNASPQERKDRFDKIVKKALEGYPPKK
ncbi:DUF4136 domain-containing protein [Christiangramia salexigens]|uniref:DUF4136 domain-containing protein n=1 Tax=Christiangramia salexigens TaxID=1913577 RepID=A0A1L3J7N4_9FLAO|nr:DUF4136 domain-containing protein [Christiangramia salexigens]APG61135.1 hypothetical protein LPB144_12315 [Christiangramia salexigens]